MVGEISHLMLDIDGVVVCGRPSDGLHWKTHLEADLGIKVADLREHFFAPYWSEIVTGHRDLRPTLTKALKNFAPDISATTLIDYWFSQDARLDTALLGDLRNCGLKVYLTTNQEHERAKFLWENLGLQNHADGMITSAKLGAQKPDAAFFHGAAEITGALAQEHLLIDDSRENIAGAKSAGWRAAHWDGCGDGCVSLKTLLADFSL